MENSQSIQQVWKICCFGQQQPVPAETSWQHRGKSLEHVCFQVSENNYAGISLITNIFIDFSCLTHSSTHRAYLHQYTKFGIQEEDFLDCFTTLEQVISSYTNLWFISLLRWSEIEIFWKNQAGKPSINSLKYVNYWLGLFFSFRSRVSVCVCE